MGEGGREKTHLETMKLLSWGSSLAASLQSLSQIILHCEPMTCVVEKGEWSLLLLLFPLLSQCRQNDFVFYINYLANFA